MAGRCVKKGSKAMSIEAASVPSVMTVTSADTVRMA